MERLVIWSQQLKLEKTVAHIRVVFSELCYSVGPEDHQHQPGCFRNTTSLAHQDTTRSQTAFNKIPSDSCARESVRALA